MDRLLRKMDTASCAGQWLLDTGLLEYLQVALKVEATDTGNWALGVDTNNRCIRIGTNIRNFSFVFAAFFCHECECEYSCHCS